MVIEYIRYVIAGDRAVAFEAAYHEASKALDASPHCQGYELSRALEHPERYILRIVWDSIEGHLEGFRRSPEFLTFLALVRPYIGAIEEMEHYEPTRVATS